MKLTNVLAVVQDPNTSSQNLNLIIIVAVVIIIILVASTIFTSKK